MAIFLGSDTLTVKGIAPQFSRHIKDEFGVVNLF